MTSLRKLNTSKRRRMLRDHAAAQRLSTNPGHVRSKAYQYPRRVPHYMGISHHISVRLPRAIASQGFTVHRFLGSGRQGNPGCSFRTCRSATL